MEPLRGEPSRVVSNHVNDHSLRVTLPSHSDAGSRTTAVAVPRGGSEGHTTGSDLRGPTDDECKTVFF